MNNNSNISEKVKSEMTTGAKKVDSIDLEAHIIATALGVEGTFLPNTSEVIEKICDLDSKDFTFPEYRELHALIKNFNREGRKINPADIRLERGSDFTTNLIDLLTVNTVEGHFPNIDNLIQKFRDAAIKRRMVKDFSGLAEGASNGKTPAELTSKLSQTAEKYQAVIQEDLPDLSFSKNRNAGRLTSTPAPRDLLAYAANQGFFPAGVVGAVISDGGAGKTSFLIQFLTALAGGQAFAPFEPVRPLRCMMLAAEDDQAELDRRLCAVTGGPENIPENLCILSVMGQAAPLMRLDGANPERTDWFRHLDRTLTKDPVDVLVLDTLSRFYGLTENSNEHAAAFISALETLAVKHSMTVLFTHHTGKASRDAGKQTTTASRGASALTDNARWVLNLERFSGSDCKQFAIDERDAGDYIKIRVTKSNYTAVTPYFNFKRTRLFCFEHVNPEADLKAGMAECLVGLIADSDQEYTIRELEKAPQGKEIAETMKENFPGFKRRTDMANIIRNCLNSGLLTIASRPSGKISKEVLAVPESRTRAKPDKAGQNTVSTFKSNEINMIKPDTDKAGHQKMSTVKSNKNNMIKLDKNHPLKGGDGPCPPFSPPGNFGPELPGNEPEQSCFNCHHQKYDFCLALNCPIEKVGLFPCESFRASAGGDGVKK